MDAEYDAGGDSFGSIFGDFLEGLGRETVGSTGPVGQARQVGSYVLEELLDFLEGRGAGGSRRSATGGGVSDGSRPGDELRMAREELATLQQLDRSLEAEAATWERNAEMAKSAGRKVAERDAMKKVFDARERRKSVRRRVLRQTEQVEYLEKVVYEVDKKREASAQAPVVDAPGLYTVARDSTKVASTLELSDKCIAELNTGAVVRVVEVTERPQEKRVRGRLESPAGWISLRNTETGFRWATPNAPASAGGGGGGARRAYSSSPAPAPAPPKKPAFDADAALQDLKKQKTGGR